MHNTLVCEAEGPVLGLKSMGSAFVNETNRYGRKLIMTHRGSGSADVHALQPGKDGVELILHLSIEFRTVRTFTREP
jgi:hypothetical protein